jgi:hypothetical protein
VEYKIHQYRFDNFTKFEDIIRQSLNKLGHIESNNPDLNIYNHCHKSEIHTNNNIIFKPTAPTSKHFALDTIGYANASTLAYEKPLDDIFEDIERMDWVSIQNLRLTSPNKWDDSILLKWRKAENIKDDHILIIGQMPDDETVNGFGFGNHINKLELIVDKLSDENIIIKLHPRYKNKQLVQKWTDAGHHVITGFDSIHSILPKTRVAIIDNSTAGIECLMHEVPIISYGWPEYHWATKKLQTLPQLKDLVNDLSWHREVYARSFIEWYINHYLCFDINSTVRRLNQII